MTWTIPFSVCKFKSKTVSADVGVGLALTRAGLKPKADDNWKPGTVVVPSQLFYHPETSPGPGSIAAGGKRLACLLACSQPLLWGREKFTEDAYPLLLTLCALQYSCCPPKSSCSFSTLTSWLTLPPLTPDNMKPPLRATLPLPQRCPHHSPGFLPSQGLSVYFPCPVWSPAGGCCYGDPLMG